MKTSLKCKCSICGSMNYDVVLFKNGFICEHCLELVRNEFRDHSFQTSRKL